jgi:hypothetical protein
MSVWQIDSRFQLEAVYLWDVNSALTAWARDHVREWPGANLIFEVTQATTVREALAVAGWHATKGEKGDISDISDIMCERAARSAWTLAEVLRHDDGGHGEMSEVECASMDKTFMWKSATVKQIDGSSTFMF